MTTFDDRKDAYENKLAHYQEKDFKVVARRNKLLGLWAADKLHKPAYEHDAYAKEVVMSDFDEPGDDDVVRKIVKDFGKAGINLTEQDIRQEMNRLLALAREQIAKEA